MAHPQANCRTEVAVEKYAYRCRCGWMGSRDECGARMERVRSEAWGTIDYTETRYLTCGNHKCQLDALEAVHLCIKCHEVPSIVDDWCESCAKIVEAEDAHQDQLVADYNRRAAA